MHLETQYDYVKSSREVLLDYCATISEKDFVAESSSFGRGSIRNLLVHIGNTYEFWIGTNALHAELDYTPYEAVKDVLQARDFFLTIDSLIARFFKIYSGKFLEEFPIKLNNQRVNATPLKLFTHGITHEFHHKGQILSLSRHLGYTPVDTDIIR